VADSHAVTHHPALKHHFENMEQQREASTIGMWVFLLTEIMFFGGLFLAYLIFRTKYFAGFSLGSHELDVTLGGVNTVVLIVSSLTMALAVYYSQVGNRNLLIFFLVVTLVLGLAFLGIKVVEYSGKIEHHLFPGPGYQPDPSHYQWAADPSLSQQVRLFLWIYFAMTGLHALHMIIGAGMLIALIYFAWRGKYSPEYHAPVELGGLYWHFVDIVWIFLFPLLYLTGFHLSNGSGH
jgi:cytochrome c oxidase subunit 3